MQKEIRIAGQGGQGIIKAGEILGKAFFYDEKNVVQRQSYGSESRGGESETDIIISDKEINDFVVLNPSIIVLLSQGSLEKNISLLKKTKLIIADERIKNMPKIKGKIYKIPIIENANNLPVNVFTLGIICSLTDIISKSALEKSIKESFSEKFVWENLNAMEEGYRLGKKIKNANKI